MSGFYSTYEELKLCIVCKKICIFYGFLQYLWGIETLTVHSPRTFFFNVFTVPMRNWNFVLLDSFVATIFGFYSTYEELKLSFAISIALLKLCFYSTYEELKHMNVANLEAYALSFLQYLWGIETKNKSNTVTLVQYVFTVPMRNWNPATGIEDDYDVMVFTVPMRNWNCWEGGENNEYNIVFTVPMRNWNFEPGTGGGSSCSGFYSTYEELKPISIFKKVSPAFRFYSTYEELKLLMMARFFFGLLRFLQYLWGIETKQAVLFHNK